MGNRPYGQGAFAQIVTGHPAWDNAHMTERLKSAEKEAMAKALLARIEERRDALGFSDNEISLVAGHAYVLRDLRGRGSIPAPDKLARIAAKLGVSTDWLLGHDSTPPADIPESNATIPSFVTDVSRSFRPKPNDLPVVGTGHCADFEADVDGQLVPIEQYSFDPDHIEAYATRPSVLNGVKEAYAIIPVGDSMYPRFGPGELQVADPRMAPRIGDDVVVQLGNGDGNVSAVLIKRLVRRSGTFIELEQFNPPQRFRVKVTQVVRIHRLMTQRELLGF